MERVKKGEKYWHICIGISGISIIACIETYNRFSDRYFMDGNYFITKEEAESMARKLRAVLKGAEIMEDWQKEKIASWDTMLETKDEISKNYSKLLNNPKVQAVLKGADVIEWPSDKMVIEEALRRYIKTNDLYCAFKNGVDWLKSNLIK